ncbi:MAG: S41 family peptidase [Candidatus Poribacteria bacterium]|nr:S41 family peptidase [Candidatus Poribacteria bacterium]
MKQHRRSLTLVVLMSIVTVASIVIWLDQSRAQNRFAMIQSYSGTLIEIISQAHDNFYKDVDDEKMLQGAIRGAVAALEDPYTFYQSPEEQQRERENLFQAKFGGLGIRIYPDQDGERGVVKVSSILPGSPALKHDIRPGDAIIEVNGESVILGGPTGLTLNDVVGKLRGHPGEAVTISVIRRNRREPIEVTLTRAVINLDSVRWTVIEDGVGYISVESFTSLTMDEFEKAVADLKKQTKLKSLILDLRDNRGGLLTAAKGMADAFLSSGTVVSTRGRNAEFDHVYPADKAMLIGPDVDVIVMTNVNSASGSEIVAGALKDTKRGITLGTKTFGKGVVQQRFDLANGGAVSLTISSYYTPNGTSIDGDGIEPNVKVDADTLTEEEAFYREKAREKRIIDDYVLAYIEQYERDHEGASPTSFTPLRDKLTDIMTKLDAENIHLDERIVRLEARGIFDLNVGTERLIDIEHDLQLIEAMNVVKNIGVAKVLDGSYPPMAQKPDDTADN